MNQKIFIGAQDTFKNSSGVMSCQVTGPRKYYQSQVVAALAIPDQELSSSLNLKFSSTMYSHYTMVMYYTLHVTADENVGSFTLV